MSKFLFKKIIKMKVKEAALKYLIEKKNEHSKMTNLTYSKLDMQPYFKSKCLNTNQVKQLFRFRTRMSNVKANFKSKYKNTGFLCPLQCGKYEDDKHLLMCSKTEIYRNEVNVTFEKIFRSDSKDLGMIINLLTKAEKIRDYLLENRNQS